MPDIEAVDLVKRVMELGRVSNDGKQYCYLVAHQDHKYHIVSDLRKQSDSFIIYNNPEFQSKNKQPYTPGQLKEVINTVLGPVKSKNKQ